MDAQTKKKKHVYIPYIHSIIEPQKELNDDSTIKNLVQIIEEDLPIDTVINTPEANFSNTRNIPLKVPEVVEINT